VGLPFYGTATDRLSDLVTGGSVEDDPGPTEGVIRDFVDHVRSFRLGGGVIRTPPHPYALRKLWMAETTRYYDEFKKLPPQPRQRQAGMSFLWHAVRCPRCMVAFYGGEIVAALDFKLRRPYVMVGAIGSRQAIRGAAFALEFEIAREGMRLSRRVTSGYAGDSRGFHVRIGRRLDKPSRGTSEWTVPDCRFIVERVEALL